MKIDEQPDKVYEDIIDRLYKKGHSRYTVREYLKKKWDIGNTCAYDHIKAAKSHFGKYMLDSNSNLLEECVAILEETRERAFKSQNLKEVRECTKEIAKLQQLYVDRLDITSKGDKLTGVNINIVRGEDLGEDD